MNLKTLTTDDIRQLADSETIYMRGQQYFKSGAVNGIKWEDNKLSAKVFGAHDQYDVEIEEKGAKLICDCTCPYEGIHCKHTVAALLTFWKQKDQLQQRADKDKARQKSLKQLLLKLDKKDLAELLVSSTKKHKHWKSVLLQKIADQLSNIDIKEDLSGVYQEQYQTLTDRAFKIIHYHNEYGGGPESEYYQVDNLLNQTSQLFKTHRLSDEIKRQYVDKLFKYYDAGNSGMDDMLMKAIDQASETGNDWQYVVTKLKRKTKDGWDQSYRQQLITDIYKSKLKDDQAYLDIRMQNLKRSGDFYDLATYWQDKGNVEKALEIAKQGVKQCAQAGELLEFLFQHYQKSDYQSALSYLKQIFQERPRLENYHRLKKFTRPDDWPETDNKCRKILGKYQPYELAIIHKESQEYDKVLAYILTRSSDYSLYYGGKEKDKLAVELISRFPNELLPYFQSKVQKHLDFKDRSHYQQAAWYAEYVKEIYCQHLQQKDSWQSYINEVRSNHAKQPALLEEFMNFPAVS